MPKFPLLIHFTPFRSIQHKQRYYVSLTIQLLLFDVTLSQSSNYYLVYSVYELPFCKYENFQFKIVSIKILIQLNADTCDASNEVQYFNLELIYIHLCMLCIYVFFFV